MRASRITSLRQAADILSRLADGLGMSPLVTGTVDAAVDALLQACDQFPQPTAINSELTKVGFQNPMAGETLRLTFDDSPIGIFLVAKDGRFLSVNPASAQIVGYSPEELLRTDFQSITHPDDLEADMEFVREMLAGTRTAYRMDKRYIHKNRTVVWIQLDVGMVHDADGNSLHFVAHVQDISHRKEAERRLKDKDARKRAITATTSDGFLEIDVTGCVLDVNDSYCNMSGYARTELIGSNLVDLIAGNNRISVDHMLRIARESGRQLSVIDQRKKSGHSWATEISVAYWSEQQGCYFLFVRDIDQRRKTEKERQRLAAILEQTTDFIGLADMNGNLLYHNRAARRLVGLPDDASLSHLKISTMHPERVNKIMAAEAIPEVLKNGIWSSETVLRHQNGSEVPVSQVLMLHRDEQGNPEYLSTIMRDLTAERERTEQIQGLQDRLQAAISVLDAGFVMYDAQERLVICNQRYREMYHIPEGVAVRGMTYEHILRQKLNSNPVYYAEMVGGDGIERWIANRLMDFRSPSSSSVQHLADRWIRIDERRTKDGGLVSLRTDVTDLKRAEFASSLQAEFLSLATTSAGIGIWEYDPSSETLIWNDRMRTIYCYKAEEFTGRYDCWADRLHPEDRVEVEEYLKRCISEGSEFKTKFRIVLPDKEVRYIDARSGFVRSPDGRLLRVVGVNIDITDHHIVQQRLRGALEAAEEATRAKAEFLATMSHEIRTPMNGVIGMANLLVKTRLSPEQREFAETIRSSGESLLTLINDILDFSKMEAGRLQLEAIALPLHQIVEEVVALFTTQAEQKGISIDYQLPVDLPPRVVGDPTRLRQIMLNLVSNAVKFTHRGKIEVRLEIVSQSPVGIRLALEVGDSGIGMTEEQVARLGEAFSQADASTTRQYGGTGLGVSICRHLAALMGGAMSIRSKPGFGTTFRIEVPMALPDLMGASIATSILSGKSLMVVSADQILGPQVVSFCEQWGIHNSRFPDATALLSHLKMSSRLPDLLVIDEQIPGIDGRMLAKLLKAEARFSSVPLIFICSQLLKPDDLSGLGCAAQVEGPLRQSRFLEALHAALRHVPELRVVTATPVARRLRAVLVAEDNLVNQRVITLMLRAHADHVVVVANGVEAVDRFPKDKWDCVLMDCQMPTMDGFEATRRIRQWELEHHSPPVPIIALTANALPSDRERCLASGMSDYLSKPLRAEDLHSVLRRVSSPAASRTVAPSTGAPEHAQAIREILLSEISENDLRDIVNISLEELPQLLVKGRQAWGASDMDALGRIIHSAKGSACALGLEEMKAACIGLEHLCGNGSVGSSQSALDRWESSILQAMVVLTEVRKRLIPD